MEPLGPTVMMNSYGYSQAVSTHEISTFHQRGDDTRFARHISYAVLQGFVAHQIFPRQQAKRWTSQLDEFAEFLNLVGNSTGLKIVFLLTELGELCVCDLAQILDLTLPRLPAACEA